MPTVIIASVLSPPNPIHSLRDDELNVELDDLVIRVSQPLPVAVAVPEGATAPVVATTVPLTISTSPHCGSVPLESTLIRFLIPHRRSTVGQ